MEQFFKKYSPEFDEDLAMDVLSRSMTNYQSERGRSSQRGGQTSRHQDESDNKSYENLAVVYEMIEDFFESKGLDPRSYIKSQRRNR